MKINNFVKVFSLTPNVCLSAVKGWTLCVLQACVLSAPTQGSSLNVASRHLQKGRADKDIDQPSEGELLMLHYFLLIPRYANAKKERKKERKTSPTYFSNCFFVQNLISSLSPYPLNCFVCASTLFIEHDIGFRISRRGISLITKKVLNLKPK